MHASGCHAESLPRGRPKWEGHGGRPGMQQNASDPLYRLGFSARRNHFGNLSSVQRPSGHSVLYRLLLVPFSCAVIMETLVSLGLSQSSGCPFSYFSNFLSRSFWSWSDGFLVGRYQLPDSTCYISCWLRMQNETHAEAICV